MKKIFKQLADWNHWPFYLFYFPISYTWVWYYIKSGSLWFFTASNPTLAFGGFEGERKSTMYNQLPQYLCPKSMYVYPSMKFDKIVEEILKQQINFPFIVKPDIGMKGILCRKIMNEAQLSVYHKNMPVDYIVQEFIDMPYEVSVFYCRMPNTEKGCITALIQKDLPEVAGDGNSTVRELVLQKYDSKKWLPSIERQLGFNMEKIPAQGEVLSLSHIANVYNGARFKNLPHEIDDQLLDIFDKISNANQFFYGRYDIKCSSIELLKKGKFIILEFNGAGSVPNHISTGSYTLLQAYKEILMHWRIMFEISEYNHKKGLHYWSFLKGHRFLQNSKKYFRVLKKLDTELTIT